MKTSTQFFLTSLSKASNTIGIFALSMIFSRYFTTGEYGTYLHIQLIVNLSTWVFLLGIPHSVYYFLPRTYEKRKFILVTLIIIFSLACIIGSSVFLTLDYISVILVNPDIKTFALLVLGLIISKIPLTIFEPLMISAKKVTVFIIVEFIFNVGFFIAILTPIVLDLGLFRIVETLFYFYSVNCLVVLIITIIIAFRFNNEKTEAGEKYKISEQLKYSIPIGLSMSVGELWKYIDKVIVSNQSTPAEYSIYARGAIDIPVISVLTNTLDNLMMPKFVEAYNDNKIDELMTIWHSIIRMMAVFVFPFCYFLIYSAELLIPALFSEKYVMSAPIFQIYTLGVLTSISTYNVIIRTIGKTSAMLWIILGGMAINIFLTFYLMQLYGLKGAPAASVITAFLVSFAYLTTITFYLGIKLTNIFPWSSLIASLITSGIALIPLLYIEEIELTTWPKLGLMSLTYGVCYLLTLRYSRALTKNDKNQVRQILPGFLKKAI